MNLLRSFFILCLLIWTCAANAADPVPPGTDPGALLDRLLKGDFGALESLFPQEKEKPWKKRNLSPAAAPVPALRYRLLPELRDLKPGNAALLYQRAINYESFLAWNKDFGDKLGDWLENPQEKIPATALKTFPRGALEELERGARCENCDWQLSDQLREKGPALPLPDLHQLRRMGQILCLRAGKEMRDGQAEKALRTLESTIALSRHLAEGPTLIHSLVAISLCEQVADQLEEFIQLPSSPNLYFALIDLPRPLVDLRKGMQGERLMMEAVFPGLRDALRDPELPPFSAKKMQEYLANWTGLSGTKGGVREATSPQFTLGIAIASAKIYPEAREHLIRLGRTSEQVDKLPIVEVALLYAWAQYEELFDESQKWANLPYWQALPGLADARAQIQMNRAEFWIKGGIPLTSFMLPAVEKMSLAQGRMERRFAALQHLEAIRLFASTQGKLPETLTLLKNTPLPLDPLRGKNFEYVLKDGKASLSAPAPVTNWSSGDNVLRYELSLSPHKKRK